MIPSNTTLREAILLFEDESQHDRMRWAAAEHIIQLIRSNSRIYEALAPQNLHTITNQIRDI